VVTADPTLSAGVRGGAPEPLGRLKDGHRTPVQRRAERGGQSGQAAADYHHAI
jgi:hypothetical protein